MKGLKTGSVKTCDSIARENCERLLGREVGIIWVVSSGSIRKTPLHNPVTAQQFLWSWKLAFTTLRVCWRRLIRARWRQLPNSTQVLNVSDDSLFPVTQRKHTHSRLLAQTSPMSSNEGPFVKYLWVLTNSSTCEPYSRREHCRWRVWELKSPDEIFSWRFAFFCWQGHVTRSLSTEGERM